MRGHLMHRGHTMTQVLVRDIAPSDTDGAVLDVALTTANESRSSLFGWTVVRLDSDSTRAVVSLHTD